MEILFVRHGLPERIVDATGPADPPLAPAGVAEAHLLAAWLVQRGQVDVVWSSPLRRALETAAPLADALGVEVLVDDDLAEYDRHSSVYVPLEELADDPELLAQVTADWAELQANPGPFRSRVTGAVDRIVAAHPGQKVAVVCHGGVINAYIGGQLGTDQVLFFEPRYTSISRVKASSAGVRSLHSLNEAPHLDATVG
jgi:2,3-bisphosphoglycerate-dependent phosphoglycerate mutase